MDVPVSLMWADNDWLADPKVRQYGMSYRASMDFSPQDVKRLSASLPRVSDNYEVPDADFNHIDLIWGIDAPDLVYRRLFKRLADFRP